MQNFDEYAMINLLLLYQIWLFRHHNMCTNECISFINDLDKYRIKACFKAETDIITSITTSPKNHIDLFLKETTFVNIHCHDIFIVKQKNET
jgi:hypothetical protein